ncbi:MAG: methyltransferase domain-containing protein [Nostoc sp. LLA-1]|nr:methyltransferase domain-containing protein [Cyanocohniella sp. LLY]
MSPFFNVTMINSNNPEINVDKLMEKISQEVANRKDKFQPLENKNEDADISSLLSNISYIESLLINAESRAYARTKWPDKLNRVPFTLNSKLQKIILKVINFFFKDQREVNFNLIFSLKESVKLNRQLIERIKSLNTQMDERLGAVDAYFQGMDERLGAVDIHFLRMDERLSAMNTHCQKLDEHLSTMNTHCQELDEHLGAVNTRFQGMDERLGAMDTHFQGMDERLGAVNTHFQGMDERLGAVDIHFLRMDERLGKVDKNIQELHERLGAVDTRFQEMDKRHIRNDSYLKHDLMQQKRLISLFLEEAQRRLPEPFNQEQLQTFVSEDRHLLDAFYVAFEDQFRGSHEDILNRLKVYLPLIEEAKIGTPNSSILDVGCGRGEWLKLLQDSGYTAKGLDINRVMLEQCRSSGLDVIEADVIAYVQSLPDNSLGAVTGFHIIEHLTFPVLMKLFSEVVRILKPGGLVIFETPNPDNVLVGSNTFYTDPTHRNPLPSSMIEFVAESYGLCRVTSIKLHPYPAQLRLAGSEVAERFNDYFYGPQDYAVIGFKP